MSRKFRLSTALDIDDLLMDCTGYAIKLATEKYKFDPPLSIYEMEHWGRHDTRIDVIYEYFNDPDFYRTQPVFQGAKEFVRKLTAMTEVFISTAPRNLWGSGQNGSWRNFRRSPPATSTWVPGRIRSR